MGFWFGTDSRDDGDAAAAASLDGPTGASEDAGGGAAAAGAAAAAATSSSTPPPATSSDGVVGRRGSVPRKRRGSATAASSSLPPSDRPDAEMGGTGGTDGGGRSAGRGSSPSVASTVRGGGGGGGGRGDKDVVLSKSTRLKGYITFGVASAINFYAADESDLRNSPLSQLDSLIIVATPEQRRYAMAVSMTTIIITTFCGAVHFDRYTCLRKAWIAAFKPGSRIELSILLFLLVWWIIGTSINTSATGAAGPGKGQYNLYFSTWVNLWTSIWTVDRWLNAAGYSSFKTFMDSWPNRAPGWIFLCVLSLADMLCLVDLFVNWGHGSTGSTYLQQLYNDVGTSEWQFHLFVTAFTIPVASGFILIELFRVTKADVENTKSDRENMIEGMTLLLLVLFWVPVVIISTTPGGSSSLVGNAYFFTWLAAIVAIETFVWWIRDWRKGIHDVVRMQEEEYGRARREALRKHEEDVRRRGRGVAGTGAVGGVGNAISAEGGRGAAAAAGSKAGARRAHVAIGVEQPVGGR